MSAKILFIEDDMPMRMLVRLMLQHDGYEMIEASDGLGGVALAAREKPDLILMDLGLPGIDGLEATARLKAARDLAAIPVIAITALSGSEVRERIIAAGCDGYLFKPVSRDELLKTVAQHLADPA